jgi:RNA recognition motif-containing protein
MSNRTIYLGNLPYSTTQDQLVKLVQPRAVKRVTLVEDKEKHRPTGYGFIEFNDPEDATTAVQFLNGIDFGGRQLRCSMAREKVAKGSRQ